MNAGNVRLDERFLVVELFGRNSGETCLLASYLSGVDRALIAEVPFDSQFQRVYETEQVRGEFDRADTTREQVGLLMASGAPSAVAS